MARPFLARRPQKVKKTMQVSMILPMMLPMMLPKCTVHKEQMLFQKANTKEQAFCGAWYKCPKCGQTCLIISSELSKQLQ